MARLRSLLLMDTEVVAFRTIFTKEIVRFMRIWIQTLVPPAITMGLYFIIFGELLGKNLPPVNGISFMDYIVPGIILMAVITNAYGNVVASFFSTKHQHYVEEMIIAPIRPSIIVAGYVSGGIARGIVVAFIVGIVAMAFTEVKVEQPWLAGLVLVLTASLFSLGGFINAVFSKTFDDISIIPTFVLTPLTYLGGVFYSVEILPALWRDVSALNPILYMVNAFRYALLGTTDVDLGLSLAVILAFNGVFAVIAVGLLRKGVGIKS